MTIVIYNSDSADGWCAAWIFDRALGGCELVPATDEYPPHNLDGKEVIVVGHSYCRDDMLRMNAVAHKLTVLDYHEGAEEACKDLSFCLYDPGHSAATLAYWWCKDFGRLEDLKQDVKMRGIVAGMSPLSDYLRDRELMTFALDASEAINAAIRSYPWTLDVWDWLAKQCNVSPMALLPEGQGILRYRRQLIEHHMGNVQLLQVCGWTVRAALCSAGDIAGELAFELSKGKPFGVAFCYTPTGDVLFHLRSDEDGQDVLKIAQEFGGDGHYHSAGFRLEGIYLRGLNTKDGLVVHARAKVDG